MANTHKVPWLDLANGIGAAAIAFMVVLLLTFFAPIEPLGPFAVVFLLGIGAVVAYGFYRVFDMV